MCLIHPLAGRIIVPSALAFHPTIIEPAIPTTFPAAYSAVSVRAPTTIVSQLVALETPPFMASIAAGSLWTELIPSSLELHPFIHPHSYQVGDGFA